MKYKIFILLIFVANLLNAQKYNLGQIFNKKFQTSFISRGDNFPDFRIKKDSMGILLICLHNNIPVSDFQKRVQFSDQKIEEISQFLILNNWAHKIDEKIKPSIFIATEKDGVDLYKYAEPIAT